MKPCTVTVNGKKQTVDCDPEMPLLWALRDNLGLTGTKYGCGVGVCGACTIHRDGKAVRSCQVPMAAASNGSFTTIEGLSANGDHPCQQAWLEEDVAQCGYCQTGMIMAAAALLSEKRAPTDADIDRVLSEQVCRCGTYDRIRKAVKRAAMEAANER